MSDSDDATSEVPDPTPHQPMQNMDNSSLLTMFSSGIEVILKKIADNLTAVPSIGTRPKLLPFDPDTTDADIENWCSLSEMVIEKKGLEGVDLILALTHSLKGRAATCLTKIQPDKVSWSTIKEMLISTFSKPMMMQDHFDQIIKFRINEKEGPAESGMRLWQLMEKIPDANLPENVMTGFAISVLSQCDDKIRRELNSVVINSKNQLFRTLRSFTLKRRLEESSSSEYEAKKQRTSTTFRGVCHFCGRIGHRGQDCRDKQRLIAKNPSTFAKAESTNPSKSTGTCYVCNDPGHLASTCPLRWKKKDDAAANTSTSSKHVNLCSRSSRGVLQINQ
ncbi:uncharacterized protein LOC125231446 isoform X1 [Leguminivora glycinivorella]|uniref:uncharacterized protein LOC125231446 isoform X1 n=1 Tax=Leguminivora glycinivorella TaxID=1035111 RepID=UPI00200E8A30|nr:uncharacterized protein LOC125231446 isoform X1 [Leguminivora glycinivorella]